jgi:hypothetical protein
MPMNARTPLAAAFLIMASNAMAQIGVNGALPVNNSAGANPLFGGSASPADDLTYKCNLPPYAACSATQLNERSQVLSSRTCPPPATSACQSFLMANGDSGTGAVQFMGAQSNPATANGEFFMKCDTVPYRPCNMQETVQRDQYLKALAKQEEASHQMVASKNPTSTTVDEIVVTGTRPLPPPFDSKDFQKELADARADNSKKVVDLGNNRIGIVNDDGKVFVCGKGQCDLKPRKPENVPGFAEAMQRDQSLNSGNVSINSENPNGTPKGVPKGVGTPPASQTPPADTSVAKSMGGDVVALQNEVSGNNFGASSASSGSGAGSGAIGGTGVGGAKGAEVVKVSKAEVDAALAKVDSEGYSFDKNRDADRKMKVIIGGAQAFNRNTTRLAEPPTDEKYVGKVQAVSNSGD